MFHRREQAGRHVAHVAIGVQSAGSTHPPAPGHLQQHPPRRRLPIEGADHESRVHDPCIQASSHEIQDYLFGFALGDHIRAENSAGRLGPFIADASGRRQAERVQAGNVDHA